jgi:hypothetical protein
MVAAEGRPGYCVVIDGVSGSGGFSDPVPP